jgi:G3E family GTPase
VLIETSGLADPGPILQSLLKDPLIAPLFALAGIVCVIDALHALMQLAESVEAREQVALADRLVLTKLDLCGGVPGAALRAQLAELNPHAEILAMPSPEQSVAGIFEFKNAGWDGSLQHAAHASHSSGIVSSSFQISEPVTWSGIAAWTAHLVERYGDDLLRCKALLRLERRPGRVVVQGVRRLFELRHDQAVELADPRSPIVFIGRRMDRADLQSGLAWLQAPEGLQQPVSRDFAPWLASVRRVQGNLT